MIDPTEQEDLYDQIIDRYGDAFKFFAKTFAPAGEAMDLLQEIKFKIWNGLDGFEGRSNPGTWAYKIAMHTAISYMRKNMRRMHAIKVYVQDLPSKECGGRDQGQMLREFVQSLPEADGELFAFLLTNVSYQEMAELTGYTEAVLRAKISRLKKQYKQRYM